MFTEAYFCALFPILFSTSSLHVRGLSNSSSAPPFPIRSTCRSPVAVQIPGCQRRRSQLFSFSLRMQGPCCCPFLIWFGSSPGLSVFWFYIMGYLGRTWNPQWLGGLWRSPYSWMVCFWVTHFVACLKINTSVATEYSVKGWRVWGAAKPPSPKQ